MSDILDRAEDLAERYNSSGFIHKEATLLLPELIAEIKRQAAYVTRLEAAYLAAKAEAVYYAATFTGRDSYSWNDYPEEPCQMRKKEFYRGMAREALEKIRGGKE